MPIMHENLILPADALLGNPQQRRAIYRVLATKLNFFHSSFDHDRVI